MRSFFAYDDGRCLFTKTNVERNNTSNIEKQPLIEVIASVPQSALKRDKQIESSKSRTESKMAFGGGNSNDPLMSNASFGKTTRRRFVDDLLAKALVSLLLIYSIVTVFTYHKVSEDHMNLSTAAVIANTKVLLESVQTSARGTVTTDTHKEDDPVGKLQRTFPLHVKKEEMIDIPHPGLDLMETEQRNQWPKDLKETMQVPRFFERAYAATYGHPEGTIRQVLGNNGERLMTPEEAKRIGSKIVDPTSSEELETIYCSVASYRDPECTLTVEDLYARAKHPDRIRVAIIDQRVDGDTICSQPPKPCEEDPNQALCKYRHLIDVYEVDARYAVGPVFARHLAHRHYRGEYFAMQIDSHVRFTEHWDDDIVLQWKQAKNEMAVLTTYLSDISGSIDPVTHESRHKTRPIMCESDYEGAGDYKHLRHGQQPEGTPLIKGEPTLHPFWAAGFSFARGHFVIQIPYDQYLPMVFQGEEISIGLRAFTYGYDFYTPERGVCFHMYAIKDNKDKRKKVPLFWENSKIYRGVGTRAMKRLNNIIGMAMVPSDDWQHDEEGRYGLGKVRKPEKFFRTFGIHTEIQQVEHHLCQFVGQPMQKKFKPALRENGMGIDYGLIDFEWKDPAPKKEKQART